MSMYFVGIDISKYKHDCCIISAANQKVVSKFTFIENISTILMLFYQLKYNRKTLKILLIIQERLIL